ncbi:SubName: Full=Uncharacterized protein {ECO:0000313/EMBL:CCA69058.1} [Serendipita indica DSM 11827]|nr:SubName: Full=Uncharacterized protein {ECO:0000313/EMBL:CCA69058.1} [Serendipita indica DSM 11827]
MNNVRRLWAGGASTTTTALEQPYQDYDSSSSTGWTPQVGSASASNTLAGSSHPTRTPSPPILPRLKTNQSPNINPRRQNSAPISPDDADPSAKRANSVSSQSSRTGAAKKHRPGHSKALSSFSKRMANGSASPSLSNQGPALNPKDELIIELLASEAVVDSRDYEILGTDQIDELKKELKALTARLNAAQKKLTLETKLRDAALSLDKVQAAHKHTGSKGTNGTTATPLETANTKVQAAQMEVSKYQDRYNQAHTRLLEHRSAVLSYSLGRLEAMVKPQDGSQEGTSGRNTPAHQGMAINGGELSPTSGNMSIAQRAKFEGAHLFAGHADAKLPPMPKHVRAQAQVAALEEQLAAAKDEADALRKEAEILRDENFRALSGWNDKLQEADDTISGLRAELQRANSSTKKLRQLEEDKRQWEEERSKLRRDLQEREEAAEFQIELDRRDGEIKQLRDMLAEERRQHEEERQRWEDEKMEDMARLQQEMEDARAHDEENARGADAELDMASERLQALIKSHSVNLTASQRRDMSLMTLCDALSAHLDAVKDEARLQELEKDEWNLTKRRMESDLKASIEKREKLSQELDEALREKDELRKELRSLDDRPRDRSERSVPSKSNSLQSDPGSSNGSRTSDDVDRIMSTLRNLWCLLPSREARAAKSSGRSASPTSPLRPMASRLGEPPSPSLSDLDVRALKALYDPRNNAPSPLFNTPSNPADFNIDAFAQRVQALVADDRAIIERLLRFAQAHDLLKNNAARAQKLAQESSMGLETYQKQVKSLEERNATLVTKQAELMDELDSLHRQKRHLEASLADQASALESMEQTNGLLTTKAAALEVAASGPESTRLKLEAQLNVVRKQLQEATEELEAMRKSEHSQNLALLEELNVVQSETPSSGTN